MRLSAGPSPSSSLVPQNPAFKPIASQPFGRLAPSTTATAHSQPVVLAALDIDQTLLPWLGSGPARRINQPVYQQYVDWFQTAQTPKNNLHLLLNTGAGLSYVQHYAQYLRPFQVDALSTDDGKHLFIHTNPAEPTDQWMLQLNPTNEVADWLPGWTDEQVHGLMRDYLLKHTDFRLYPRGESWKAKLARLWQWGRISEQAQPMFVDDAELFQLKVPQTSTKAEAKFWQVEMSPGKTIVSLYPVNRNGERQNSDSVDAQKGQELANAWFAELKQKLTLSRPLHMEVNPMGAAGTVIHVGPEGIDKGAVTEAYIKRSPHPLAAVITAGDSKNDFPMMAPPTLGGLPNYPIQVGNNPGLSQALAQAPPRYLVQAGDHGLQEALETQLKRAQTETRRPLKNHR